MIMTLMFPRIPRSRGHVRQRVAKRHRGGARPAVIATAALLAVFVVSFVAWLAQTGATLADIETRLHEEDRFAEFVDRRAPGFTLTRADGRAVDLDDFRGRIVVLNFVYARCTDICPPHMAVVADLQERLVAAGLADEAEFVTLATDTEDAEETAAIAGDYGERFGMDPDNWHMLYRGGRPPRTVIELAAEYGLGFRVVEASDGNDHAHESEGVERQVHGAVTHVIGPDGRLRARLHGLRFDPATFTAYVRALAESGSTS